MSNQSYGPTGELRQYTHVAAAILEDVRLGNYRSGELLPSDRQLAESLGVSRPTVREALVALEVAGIVSSSRGAGVRVRACPQPEVPAHNHDLLARPFELIEARSYWEPALIPLVVDRMRASDLDHLAELTEAYDREARAEHMTATFAEIGLRFHTALADITGNSIFSLAVANLASYEQHPLWVLLNESAMRSLHARKQQVAAHSAILVALRDRATDRAQHLLQEHLVALKAQVLGPRLQMDVASLGAGRA